MNGYNYKIWHHKVWYILEEQVTLETLNHVMQELEQQNFTQHKRDQEAYGG